jgi:7-cyano-7-deazaguanine synthase
LDTDKFGILQDGLVCCSQLGISFDEVYKRTNTSYKPYPSGNSDYKSAASVERIEAFIKLGRPDPVQYEDETGPVSWEVAKSAVEKVLSEHKTSNL